MSVFKDFELYKPTLTLIFNQSIFCMSESTFEQLKKYSKKLKKEGNKRVLDASTLILKCLSTVSYTLSGT